MVAEAAHLPTPNTFVTWDPAQQRFFLDMSRVIAVCWHRQKGKDFCAAGKAVASAFETGQSWFIVSLTQRQADATFAKCKQFLASYKEIFAMQGEITFSEQEYVEYVEEINEHFKCTAREITLPNGGRIVSLPGRNPDTLAGLTGNIILTEFGLFPNGGYDHWRVIFPLTTRGFQAIIISTPRGKNTKFYEIVSSPETYSVHFCDIHQSVAEGYCLRDNNGLPCTLETFKAIYGDPAGWAREYECQFTGDLDALITWAQIMIAADLDVSFRFCRIEGESGWDESFFASLQLGAGMRLELGWDVARKSHLSSLWINAGGVHGKARTLTGLVIMHNASFALQRRVIQAGMDQRWSNVGCGDSTGLGMDSNETLQFLYRDRWEPVNFAGTRKAELASGLKTNYGDRTQLLPVSCVDGEHKFVATDLYSIQKDETGGKLKLEETQNVLMEESHCDIAWSNALALRASMIQPKIFCRAPLLDKPEVLL